jgi:alpha-L-rhamnosidase
MDWRKRASRDFLGIGHGNDWGDWLSFGNKTPLDYIDTVYFAHTAQLMAEMAQATGKDAEAAAYRELFNNVKAAFNRKYLKPDGSLTVDTQTAYALALFMELIPADLRAKSGKILADKLRTGETADNSGMTTGFLGTRPLLPVLTSIGENDLAVKHFQSRKFPSWGYEVEQGATTIWERWNSFTKDKGFGDAGMNSFSHYSFGAVCEWMLGDLAGIQSDGLAYRKIIIRPQPPTPGSNPEHAPIHWVKARHDSIRGRIESQWRVADGRFELQTTIPANTTATVYLPTSAAASITESGKPLTGRNGVDLLRVEDGRAVIAVESGCYRFSSPAFAPSHSRGR